MSLFSGPGPTDPAEAERMAVHAVCWGVLATIVLLALAAYLGGAI